MEQQQSILTFAGFTKRLQDAGEIEKLSAFTEAYGKLKGNSIEQTLFLLAAVSKFLGIPSNDGSPEWSKHVMGQKEE